MVNEFIGLKESSSMHVTLIFVYSKERFTGGPEGVAFDTVEGLKKNHARLVDNDIHIHIMSAAGNAARSRVEVERDYENLTFEYFKRMLPSALLADLNYCLRMRKRRGAIDLVHSHPISGAVAGCMMGLSTMLTLHGMYWKEGTFSSNPYTRLSYALNTRRFGYVSQRLVKLIAISPYVIDEVDQYYKNKDIKGEVIENPIADVFFSVRKEESDGLILYPGVISRRKNQMGLVKALNILKNDGIPFHCVMPGPCIDPDYLAEIKKEIERRGLEKEITIPGAIPFTDLLHLYEQAGAMVMTTLQETAPMVISEAMATGTPVIAPRISGIPYMVSDGETGFLTDPGRPEETAKYLAILLDEPGLRRDMGIASKRVAEARWRNDLIVGKQLDLYLDVDAQSRSK